ncbi:MAG: hypothetical protein ABSH48_26105 [Verrucomicrobiota bacterium]
MAEAGFDEFVVDPVDVKDSPEEVLNHNGPALIDAAVNHLKFSMPPHLGLERVEGFSHFMLKGVVSRRGEELVELAKTNLRR